MKKILLSILLVLSISITGCVNTQKRMLDGAEAVRLRSIQSRSFDTSDKERVLRVVIATLQDLGFVVDKADLELGSVSGTKLDRYELKMTVSVRPKSDKQLIVRGNAQFGLKPVEEEKPYQDFFNALSKSLFLEAHFVE
jgi:hypothetical protein